MSPCTVKGIERFAAPIIIGLKGRDARLDEIGRGACIVTDDKNNIALIARRLCGQFDKIDPAGPVRGIRWIERDGKGDRIVPAALD